MTPKEQRSARVSIGLPVYNGAPGLRVALQGISRQTFADFEVLIADNGSEDATPEICREFVDTDPRFRYTRHDQNLGAVRNFNFVARETAAPLFMWHSHDDVAAPTYLESCVEALDRQPACVLAYSDARSVDEAGRSLDRPGRRLALSSDDPVQRFTALLDPIPYGENVTFGLMRRDCLRKTRLLGDFGGCDRAFYAELALLGPFCKVPGVLFQRGVRTREMTARETEWYNRGRDVRATFREWRIWFHNLQSAWLAPADPPAKVRLARALLGRLLRLRGQYAWELANGVKSIVRPGKD